MLYAMNQGLRIRYELVGDGPPLVIRLGITNSIEDAWHYGWVDGLKDSYRLVLVDVRGHGGSDKPHDPALYGSENMAGDVLAVLDKERIARTSYFGYSMGGAIAFGLAKLAPQKLVSLIIGGAQPYGATPARGFARPAARAWVEKRLKALRQEGMAAFVRATEEETGPFDPETRARRLANDPEAIAAAMEAATSQPSLEAVLPTMKMPCLLFAGELDVLAYAGIKECVKQMPNARFMALPGLNHGQAGKRPDLVLSAMREFLAEATEAESNKAA